MLSETLYPHELHVCKALDVRYMFNFVLRITYQSNISLLHIYLCFGTGIININNARTNLFSWTIVNFFVSNAIFAEASPLSDVLIMKLLGCFDVGNKFYIPRSHIKHMEFLINDKTKLTICYRAVETNI